MIHLITLSSRITLLIFMALYTMIAFIALRRKTSKKRRARLYIYQNFLMFLLIADANVVLFANSQDFRYLLALVMEVALMFSILMLYNQIYPEVERSLVNFLTVLLSIGLIIMSRLSLDRFMHQYLIALLGLGISIGIPAIIRKFPNLDQLVWGYAGIGIVLLAIVFLIGTREYGAKLSISLAGFSFQPTEFVKISFVLYFAAALSRLKKTDSPVKLLVILGIACLHLLILAASKDLGAASIFFVVMVGILYAWSGNLLIMIGGFGMIGVGLVLLSTVFAHVSDRLMAWLHPLKYVEDQGYQVSQSLFAIAGGSWFGSGLLQGMPEKIPVVAKDFVFAAISEELGALFAICLLFLCISCFIMMMNVAMKVRRPFFKLTAVGLGTAYGFQLLLSVGGVIRFIPSTGVTFPLISYGGSSLISSMILFSIIEGIYLVEGEDRRSEEA